MDDLSSKLRDLETPTAAVSLDQVRVRVGRQRRRESVTAVLIALALLAGSVGLAIGFRPSAAVDVADSPAPKSAVCAGTDTAAWAPTASGTVGLQVAGPITAAWWCSNSDDWVAPSGPLATSLDTLSHLLESLPPLDDPSELMQCSSSSPDYTLVLESAGGRQVVQASLGNCEAVTSAGRTRGGAAQLRADLSELWRQQRASSTPSAQPLACAPSSSLVEVRLTEVTRAIGCGATRGELDPDLVDELVRVAALEADPVTRRPPTAVLRLVLADAHSAPLPVFVDDQQVLYFGDGLRWQPDVSDGKAGELARRLEPFLR